MTISRTDRQINFLRNQGVPLMKARRSIAEDGPGPRLDSGESVPPAVFLSGVTHPDGVRAQATALAMHRGGAAPTGVFSVERLRVMSVFGQVGPRMSSYVYDVALQIVLQRPGTRVFVWTRAEDDGEIATPLLARLPATIYAFSDADITMMSRTAAEPALLVEARLAVQSSAGPSLLIVDSGLRYGPVGRAVLNLVEDPQNDALDVIAIHLGRVVFDGLRYDVAVNVAGSENVVQVSGAVSTTFPFPDQVLDHIGATSRRPTSTVITAPHKPQSLQGRASGEVDEFSLGTSLLDPGRTVRVSVGNQGHAHIDGRLRADRGLPVLDALIRQAADKAFPEHLDRRWSVLILPVSAAADEVWHQAMERWASLPSVAVVDSPEQVLAALNQRAAELRQKIAGFTSWPHASDTDLHAAAFEPVLLAVPDPVAIDETMDFAIGKILRQGSAWGVHVVICNAKDRESLNCAISVESATWDTSAPMVVTDSEGRRVGFMPFSMDGEDA